MVSKETAVVPRLIPIALITAPTSKATSSLIVITVRQMKAMKGNTNSKAITAAKRLVVIWSGCAGLGSGLSDFEADNCFPMSGSC